MILLKVGMVALMKRPEQKAKEAIRDSNQFSGTRKSKEESVANNMSNSNRKNKLHASGARCWRITAGSSKPLLPAVLQSVVEKPATTVA